MAGGYQAFGPTFNSTPFVRLGIEGLLGSKTISSVLVADAQLNQAQQLNGGTGVTNYPLAGTIAFLDANGNVTNVNDANAKAALGLFREDLGDMVNASSMATYYFGFGEYYVAESRLSSAYVTAGPAVGDALTVNNKGQLTKTGVAGETYGPLTPTVGTVTYVGTYPAGNMYANAGDAANGGQFVGFLLKL